MFKSLVLSMLFVFLVGCASTSKTPLPAQSFNMTFKEPSYCHTQENPIELGGCLRGIKCDGAQLQYFPSFLDPDGVEVYVKRLGSCCAFEDPSIPLGGGLLDMYELTYDEISKPIFNYVNLYKFVKPKAPKNFVLL